MTLRIFDGELPDGLSIKRFAIREKKVGDGPIIVANAAKFHADAVKAGGEAYGMAMLIESIRHCLIEVDGLPVAQPYMAMNEWSDETANAVAEAYIGAFRGEMGKAKGQVRMT